MGTDAVVLDRVEHHRTAVARHGLAPSQAWVHLGLLFGWAADRGLVADWLLDRTPDAFTAFAARTIKGSELVAVWDGVLLDDMFSDEGLAFIAAYLGRRGASAEIGHYVDDYRRTLCEGLPSEYHVDDSWESYERLVPVIDQAHQRFVATFDAGAPRLDLRGGEASLPAWTGPAWLPTVDVPDAIALPKATIGMVVAQSATVAALDRARSSSPPWFVLRMPGVSVGVAATVARRFADPTPPRAERVLATLLTRVCEAPEAPGEPPFPGAWWVERAAEPAWEPEHEGWASEIRSRVADRVAARRRAGEPPGMLALALTLSGLALLDAVGGELLTDQSNRLALLRARRTDDRVHIVLEALRRAGPDPGW